MSPQKFLDALGHLDDQYIQQAAEYNGKRRKFSRMIGTAAAACLVVLVSRCRNPNAPERRYLSIPVRPAKCMTRQKVGRHLFMMVMPKQNIPVV